jgi:hypothetical protein
MDGSGQPMNEMNDDRKERCGVYLWTSQASLTLEDEARHVGRMAFYQVANQFKQFCSSGPNPFDRA